MRTVEWGSSHFEQYVTQQKVEDDYFPVDADTFQCFVETYEEVPEQLREISAYKTGLGTYFAEFYADKTLCQPKDKFYISFYWTYQGSKMCERVPVQVLTDK
jgi:hypothetical protein